MLAVELGVTSVRLFRPLSVPIETYFPLFRARSRVTQRDKLAAHTWANLINEEYSRLSARNAIPSQLTPTAGADPAEAA